MTDKKKTHLKVVTPKMVRAEKAKSKLVVELRGTIAQLSDQIIKLEGDTDVYMQEIAKLVDKNVDKNVKLISAEKTIVLRKTVIGDLEKQLEQLRYDNQISLENIQSGYQYELAAISSQRDQLVGYIQGSNENGLHHTVEYDASGNQKKTALDLFLDKCTAEVHVFKNQAGYR